MTKTQKQTLIEEAKAKINYAVKELTKPVTAGASNEVSTILARISDSVNALEEAEQILLPANRL